MLSRRCLIIAWSIGRISSSPIPAALPLGRAAMLRSLSAARIRRSVDTGALILADGTVFWGRGFGAAARAVGEVCFNTSITGYQEILTDPSYAGQIITFTFPHIGNVGTNPEDIETVTPAARGLIVRADVTEPANYLATQSLDAWLRSHGIVGLSGVD